MIVEKSRLNELFERMRGKKIAVLGDVMLDRYIWGSADRISPEAPVPVVFVEGESSRLGGAANVAWNVVSLGASPMLFGMVGDDRYNHALVELMSEYGIAGDYLIVDHKRPTITKTRIIARGQQIVRIDREIAQDMSHHIEKKLIDELIGRIDEMDGLIVSDYGKGVITRNVLESVVPAARKKGIFIAVDPKERHFELYNGSSIVTPNGKEAGGAVGIKITDESSLITVGNKLKQLTGAENILVTRGADGMSLFKADGTIENFPTLAKQVYDVTGAGDTVVSVFAAVCSAGGSLREGAIISSHAAGIVVGKIGTAIATPDEIQKSIEEETIKRGSKW
jgi:D-glycero-beta-D-manno-heptose-7-phosphate kinase